MSDAAIAALITVGGMVGVATLSALIQYRITRLIIRTDYDKLAAKLRSESSLRRWEAKHSKLLEVLGELIPQMDPDLRGRDISKWLPLVHKAQLLLRYDNGLEQKLNGSINDLGYALQGIHGPQDRGSILALQNRVIEDAKALFAQHYGAQ